MNKSVLAVASALLMSTVFAASDETPKAENPSVENPSAEEPVALEQESSIKWPTVEAGVFYRTMKIERGMVENDESVFGYEAEIEWYGLFGGVEACYDMTDINERRGRYNEIESFLGYGLSFGDFTAKAAYAYKACGGEESDTEQIEFEVEYETPWVTPFAEFQIDTKDVPGAFYGLCGLTRTWALADGFALVTDGEIGFGNKKRNEADFERRADGARHVRLGAALEIELCPHLKLVPSIDFYDYFTEAQRASYDKFNGFVCAAGCRLVIEF